MAWPVIAAYLAERAARRSGDGTPGNTERMLPSDGEIVSGASSGVGNTVQRLVNRVPGGRISVILFLIVFLLLAIQQVGSGGATRLQLLFMSLTGRAQLRGVDAVTSVPMMPSAMSASLYPLASDIPGGPIS